MTENTTASGAADRRQMGNLKVVPVTFKQACEFVRLLHRHNKPPRGHKFSVGLMCDNLMPGDPRLVGVAMAGRPIARALDDGLTLEVNRTCTDGTKNANSMLYGAVWRAAVAMGYQRCVTYTQADESGASLRAAGWTRAADLPARRSWSDSTQDLELKTLRDPIGNGGVSRVRWEKKKDTP